LVHSTPSIDLPPTPLSNTHPYKGYLLLTKTRPEVNSLGLGQHLKSIKVKVLVILTLLASFLILPLLMQLPQLQTDLKHQHPKQEGWGRKKKVP
jgi:hypothetical protein